MSYSTTYIAFDNSNLNSFPFSAILVDALQYFVVYKFHSSCLDGHSQLSQVELSQKENRKKENSSSETGEWSRCGEGPGNV